MGAPGQLGRHSWWRHAGGAAADAADGSFFVDPLPQGLIAVPLKPAGQRGTRWCAPGYGCMVIHTKLVATLTAAALAMPTLSRAQAPATPTTPPPPTAIQNHPDANVDCAPSKLSNPNARPGVTTGQSQSDSAPLSDRLAAARRRTCPLGQRFPGEARGRHPC